MTINGHKKQCPLEKLLEKKQKKVRHLLYLPEKVKVVAPFAVRCQSEGILAMISLPLYILTIHLYAGYVP